MCDMQELQQRIQRMIVKWQAKDSKTSDTEQKDEMEKIRKEIVNFHGEMVLLVNYSNINYTGNTYYNIMLVQVSIRCY